MFALIRASFNHRRKTLVNGLTSDLGGTYTKDRILEALKACGFKETVRGEELTLAQFAELSEAL
jgi:16S rRNA (adenine1518-N6/adenine1519-N6)-dimethyltransferase